MTGTRSVRRASGFVLVAKPPNGSASPFDRHQKEA